MTAAYSREDGGRVTILSALALPSGSAPALARLSGVSHRYGDVLALDRLDLEVREGEVLAVLGPNGAGKTTAVSLLLGTLTLQTGAARVFGSAPDAVGVRLRRGAMLQVSGVPETLTVGEHLALFRAYYPSPLPTARLLEMAGLQELRDRRFGKLSGGQKQRVMFALALAGNPELVFLDEPTAGLDLDGRRRLWDEIRGLKAAGRTAVLTTHYLEEADALADRIAVIHRGRLIAEGSPEEIKSRTAGRVVRCVTTISAETARSFPEAAGAEMKGQHLEVVTAEPEAVLRRMFALDPELGDLTVVGVGLEEAFLALTGDGAGPEGEA